MKMLALRLMILSIALLLTTSFSLHNFVQHEHHGEYHDEHGEEHSNKTESSIQAFFHGDDRKMFWMLLGLILAIFGAGIFFEKNNEALFLPFRIYRFQYFITPLREAFRRGLIQHLVYD